MNRTEVRIAGIGGQGVVLSGVALGRAVSVYERRHAVQTQAYGSDIRGGDVCTELVVAEQEIVYPAVKRPDILVALAQKAFEDNAGSLAPGGLLIVDADLVDVRRPGSIDGAQLSARRMGSASFNRIAIEELGSKTAANMLMLGYLVAATSLVSRKALESAVRDLVPPHTLALNLRAIDRGIELEANS